MNIDSRLPWAVPVTLVRRETLQGGAGDAARRATGHGEDDPVEHVVDVGCELPGVERVTVTTVSAGGRRWLSTIIPTLTSSKGRGQAGPKGRAVPLADVLADLEVDGAVPILLDGTAFAAEVLTALAGVGPGDRCTYTELAALAGRPRAVRAAAHVMATNPAPLVLPCHRVVPSGGRGRTGRYGWGDAVKPVLLDLESPLAA